MEHGSIRKAALETVGLGVVLALALFASAGSLSWPMAWTFLAFYAAFSIAWFAVLPADLIAERSGFPAGAKPADLLIAGLAFFLLLPVSLVVCGLDARFHGSPPIPPGARVPALGVFTLGYGFSLWGLVPALLGCAFLALRIRYEERVLGGELAGYGEYVRRVRWRLIPHVW